MSVATRLQAIQPTDIGVPGPTSLDMARAFRSVRADPLAFLGRGLRALRRPGLLPGARAAGAAGQRPGRRPPRAADRGPQLGQADRAVRRAGAGHRPGPAGLRRSRAGSSTDASPPRPSTTSASTPSAEQVRAAADAAIAGAARPRRRPRRAASVDVARA